MNFNVPSIFSLLPTMLCESFQGFIPLSLTFLQGGNYPTGARRLQGAAFLLDWSVNWSTLILNNLELSLCAPMGFVLVLPYCILLDFKKKFITEIPGTSCDHKSVPFYRNHN